MASVDEPVGLSAPLKSVRVSFEQLALMLHGGLNVAEALAILERTNEDDETLSTAFHLILKGLQSGQSLSAGLLRFPKIFPAILTRLVHVGEQSGRLVPSISLATMWMRRQEDLGQKLKRAFTYPATVLVVAVIVNLLVLRFCIPQMRDMIQSFGGSQPLLTRAVFSAGDLAVHPVTLLLLASTCLLLWYKRHFIQEKYGFLFFRLVHQLPFLGPTMRCAALARICSTLATCLEVNLTFLRCFSLSMSASGDPVYERTAHVLLENVKDGGSLAEALRIFPDLYPGVVWQSVQVGEESGHLPESLRSITKLIEDELDYRIEVLTNMLEPLVLVFCALFVGIFILAIFLPMQGFLAQLAS